MNSSSFLDQLFGFFFGSANIAVITCLPWLLLQLCGLWLALVGWSRHRVPGFLILVIGSAFGVASLVLQAISFSHFHDGTGMEAWFSFSFALDSLSKIAFLFGVGHLAYSTKFTLTVNRGLHQS